MEFSLVATVDDQSGRLLPSFMHPAFAQLTTAVEGECEENAVVMGRKTWQQCVRQPLWGRLNLVLSRDPLARLSLQLPGSVLVGYTLDRALQALKGLDCIQTAFVIGGKEVFEEAIQHPLCSQVLLLSPLKCALDEDSDMCHFPLVPAAFTLTSTAVCTPPDARLGYSLKRFSRTALH